MNIKSIRTAVLTTFIWVFGYAIGAYSTKTTPAKLTENGYPTANTTKALDKSADSPHEQPSCSSEKNLVSLNQLNKSENTTTRKQAEKSGNINNEDHFLEGMQAFKQGDIHKAKDTWENALKDNPTNIELLQSLRMAYEAEGNFSGYLDLYDQLLKEHPDSVELHGNLARLWVDRGEPEKAIDLLERAALNNKRVVFILTV